MWLMMSLHKYPQIPSLQTVTSSVVKDIPSRAKLRCAQSASDSLSLFSPSLSRDLISLFSPQTKS